MNCEHCNSIDLVPYMPGKFFCLTCQRITTISPKTIDVLVIENGELKEVKAEITDQRNKQSGFSYTILIK